MFYSLPVAERCRPYLITVNNPVFKIYPVKVLSPWGFYQGKGISCSSGNVSLSGTFSTSAVLSKYGTLREFFRETQDQAYSCTDFTGFYLKTGKNISFFPQAVLWSKVPVGSVRPVKPGIRRGPRSSGNRARKVKRK